MRHDRLNAQALSPELFHGLIGVEQYLRQNVDSKLFHLVKLRASMINGCANCIDMHSTDALAEGETTARLFGVAAWRETPLFTDAERAALALTDAVTELGQDGVPDEVWDEAAAHFDEKALTDLLGAIAMINLWNRLSISLRITPASAKAA
jgi:AhpD family alkylhydroperoxidase